MAIEIGTIWDTIAYGYVFGALLGGLLFYWVGGFESGPLFALVIGVIPGAWLLVNLFVLPVAVLGSAALIWFWWKASTMQRSRGVVVVLAFAPVLLIVAGGLR